MALSGFWFAEQAKDYFRRAAEAGDSHGNYNLGVLYLQGMGVKKDVKEACKNFLMAADKGHPKAFYQLAKMQQKGIPGMKKDVATVSTNAFVYENVHAPSALFPRSLLLVETLQGFLNTLIWLFWSFDHFVGSSTVQGSGRERPMGFIDAVGTGVLSQRANWEGTSPLLTSCWAGLWGCPEQCSLDFGEVPWWGDLPWKIRFLHRHGAPQMGTYVMALCFRTREWACSTAHWRHVLLWAGEFHP